MLPALPVGLAVPAIIALGVIDRHRENYSGLMADGLWAQLTPCNCPLLGVIPAKAGTQLAACTSG
jgi:hypothetical protein